MSLRIPPDSTDFCMACGARFEVYAHEDAATLCILCHEHDEMSPDTIPNRTGSIVYANREVRT